jgi:hypothetical protein
MELLLDRPGADPELAHVTKRLKDKDGRPIGTSNKNPILDTRLYYEVEYKDGYKAAMAANTIAENLFLGNNSQVRTRDPKGLTTIMETHSGKSQ